MTPSPDPAEPRAPAPEHTGDTSPAEDTRADKEIERLRTLLFHRELLLLEQLRARLDSPDARAGDVGSVLAEALVLSSREDDRLKMAMEPLVDRIVKESLRDNPHEFSESLFPLMGPSIRKSIAESFHAMLESFSKSMETAFSWKGIRWRLESLRTGKPFSEVVLLHTLVYRVDAVYFIHSATGISLASVMNEGTQSGDSDMVSAMLTAIQDFVNDCLADGKKEDLDLLRQGEYTLLVERRPAAYLACVLRGAPPADYRAHMRACLEYLVMEYAGQLANFKGDTGPFAASRPRLEKLLGSRFVDEDKPLPVWIKLLVAALIAACPGAAGYVFYRHRENAARAAEDAERRRSFRADMLAAVDLLRREPGLLVIHAAEQPAGDTPSSTASAASPGNSGQNRDTPQEGATGEAASPAAPTAAASLSDHTGQGPAAPPEQASAKASLDAGTPWKVVCLKDRLARTPEEVLREHGKDASLFSFTLIPYVSYEPDMVSKRVDLSIQPPENVSMRFDDGIIYLSGTAPMHWTLEARRKALTLPGVKDVDIRGLSDPRSARLAAMIQEVQGASVEFPLGKDVPVPEDMPKLTHLVDTLAAVQRLAAEMGMAVSLTIYGHADAVGSVARNYDISQARAKVIAAMLYARGSGMPLALYGLGADYARKSEGPDQSSRRIELRVHLSPSVVPELDFINH
ncbi:MAG: hypothetical protein LBC14_04810 [Desulfovibrio sp.]|jgi:outer membrane protein OmpA-like peptidoglycan-associated protein|nr:hypothetical protein [Desulfovibrio sp.]